MGVGDIFALCGDGVDDAWEDGFVVKQGSSKRVIGNGIKSGELLCTSRESASVRQSGCVVGFDEGVKVGEEIVLPCLACRDNL